MVIEHPETLRERIAPVPRGVSAPVLFDVIEVLSALHAFVGAVDMAAQASELQDAVDEADDEALASQAAAFLRILAIESMLVTRLSMNSPLTIELAVAGISSAGVVSTVVYLFKNPDKIGEWFPKLQVGWYNGRAEAEKARKAYEKLRDARTKIRELES